MKKKPTKEMPYKDLIQEHKEIVNDLKAVKDQYNEQKKELNQYLREYAKLKGYAQGGDISETNLKDPDQDPQLKSSDKSPDQLPPLTFEEKLSR